MSPRFSHSFSAIVLNKLTSQLPRETIEQRSWPHTETLQLADPHFWRPARIDCLLGADVYPFILKTGCRTGEPNTPMAQLTEFDWTLIGTPDQTPSSAKEEVFSCQISVEPSIASLLTKFWEIEETIPKPMLSPAEIDCDRFYDETT